MTKKPRSNAGLFALFNTLFCKNNAATTPFIALKKYTLKQFFATPR
jgi:hypothetical protein